MKLFALLFVLMSATTVHAANCIFSKGEVFQNNKRVSQHFNPRILNDRSLSVDRTKPAEIVIQGNSNFDIYVVGDFNCNSSETMPSYDCFIVLDYKTNNRFRAYVGNQEFTLSQDISIIGGGTQIETYSCK